MSGWVRGNLTLLLFVPVLLAIAFGFWQNAQTNRDLATQTRAFQKASIDSQVGACESSNRARQDGIDLNRGTAGDLIAVVTSSAQREGRPVNQAAIDEYLARLETRYAAVEFADCEALRRRLKAELLP